MLDVVSSSVSPSEVDIESCLSKRRWHSFVGSCLACVFTVQSLGKLNGLVVGVPGEGGMKCILGTLLLSGQYSGLLIALVVLWVETYCGFWVTIVSGRVITGGYYVSI